MNERIRELAEQAWDETKEKFGSFVDDGGEVDFTFLHAYDKRFAELIVKECAQVAWQHTPDTEELEYSHLIKDKILANFGVEE